MRVLVTGSDGVLGSNLVRELISRNYDVNVLLEQGKKSPTLEGLNITRFHGTILDDNDLNNAFKGCDAVVHGAASTSVFPARNPQVNRVNIDGTQKMIDAALRHKVKRFIFVGTANSFGYGDEEKPGKEGDPYQSFKYGLDYMDSKYYAQEKIVSAVKSLGLPAIVVNPTFMIGPYDSRPSSGAMILAVHKGKIPGYTLGGKNYVAVKDAATAIANAITMGRIGEAYILGNVNLTYKKAFETIASVINTKPPKNGINPTIVKAYGSLNSFFARFFNYYPGITKELALISCEKHYYSPEKARKELKLPQTPIEVAIKECYDWFEENNYLEK
ncbi:MAG: NAD-dependent epimerase/dehydratase family protein [Crocinitomicaceae bacterium]|nr:NAD-dependent epimerase/dehydratase family protein [Crocinitomicaceae bacterium]